MVAPTYAAAGTANNGSGTSTLSPGVPSGVVLNSMILALVIQDPTTTAVTSVPSGFTEAPDSPITVTGTQAFKVHVYWKRQTSATGAGETTGTYSFTFASSLPGSLAQAFRFSDVITTGNPFDVTNSAIRTTTTSGVTPAVSDTTTGSDELFVWMGISYFDSVTCTTVTGFTENVEYTGTGFGVALDTKTQATAAASGSLTATFSDVSSGAAWLGALLPVSAPPPGNTTAFFMML